MSDDNRTRRFQRIVVPEAVAYDGYPSGIIVEGLLFLSGLRTLSDPGRPHRFDDLPNDRGLGRQGYWLAEADEELVTVDGWNAHDALDRVLAAVGSTERDMLRLRIWQSDKHFYPAYERVRRIRQPLSSPSSGHCADPGLGSHGRSIGLDGIAITRDRDRSLHRDNARSNEVEPKTIYPTVVAQHNTFAFMSAFTPVKQQPGFPTVLSFDDIPEEGRIFATGRSHTDSRDGPIAAQTWYVLDKIRSCIGQIGGSPRDIVHFLVGLKDLRDLATFHRVYHDFFGDDGPALTIFGASEVGHRLSRVYVEPTAYLGDSTRGAWPGSAPIAAPFSRSAGRLTFFSGILPIGANDIIVNSVRELGPGRRAFLQTIAASGGETFTAQCWQVWSNLEAALQRSGSSLRHIVKLTVFLADRSHWPIFEAVRACFLMDDLPAIEALVVRHPGPNAACLIQIDVVALQDSHETH